MFQWLWLRRMIRKRTNYIPEDRAAYWKLRLSIIYAVVAWNAFGFVGYMIYTGKTDWSESYRKEKDTKAPAQQWAAILGIKEAKVYRISGFNVTDYEITDKEKQNK